MTTKAIEKNNDIETTGPAKYSVRPKARVYENNDSFMLDLEMPGISEADAEITLQKNNLTVAGEAEGLEVRYERSFRLPETINPDNVTATMQFGILKLVLPKVEEVKPKTIKVIAG